MDRKFELAPGCRLLQLAAAVAYGLSGAVCAATITVDNGSAGSVSGSCTIVDAAASINQGHTVPGSSCVNTGAAFGTSDTIDFSANFAIAFTAPAGNAHSALLFNKPVAINGALDSSGQPLVTIARKNSAKTQFRVIETGANIVLSGVTIRGGDSDGDGGGVFASGNATVTLNNAVVDGNAAAIRGGGIYASNGLVTLNDATVSGNTAPTYGGGIYSFAGATISRSTVSGNSSGQGGGVLSGGPFTATGSTISGNSAVYTGGGVYAFSRSTLTDTTISGNSATRSGGGISTYGISLKFCTITGNDVGHGGVGAGVYLRNNDNTATAALIADNSSANDVDAPPSRTMALAGDHNLIRTHSSLLAVPGDTKNCDPSLGPLSANGGATQTHPLFDGSCAIDAGPAFVSVQSDQRGFTRDIGAATDIGAFEKQGANDPIDTIFAGSFE